MSTLPVHPQSVKCVGCSQLFHVSVLTSECLCSRCDGIKGSKSLGFLWIALGVEEGV